MLTAVNELPLRDFERAHRYHEMIMLVTWFASEESKAPTLVPDARWAPNAIG